MFIRFFFDGSDFPDPIFAHAISLFKYFLAGKE